MVAQHRQRRQSLPGAALEAVVAPVAGRCTNARLVEGVHGQPALHEVVADGREVGVVIAIRRPGALEHQHGRKRRFAGR
jgi:hypothetical protein